MTSGLRRQSSICEVLELLELWGQEKKQSGEFKASLGRRLKGGLRWVTWRAGGDQVETCWRDTGRLSPGHRTGGGGGGAEAGWMGCCDDGCMGGWGDRVFPDTTESQIIKASLHLCVLAMKY